MSPLLETFANASKRGWFSAVAGPAAWAYFAGGLGNGTGRLSSIQKFVYATDIRSTLTATLSDGTYLFAGMANSGVAGYFAGGNSNAGYSRTQDKINFTNDSKSTTTLLNTASQYHSGFANSGTAGYYMAVSTSTYGTTTGNKFAFPSDTITTGNFQSVIKNGTATFANKGVAGYSCGGNTDGTPNPNNDTRNTSYISFPSDTLTNAGNTLSQSRRWLSGMENSGTAGYACAGEYYTTGYFYSNVIDKMAMPAQTWSTLGTGLSSNRTSSAGTGAKGVAGYVAGGNPAGDTAGSVATVDKFTFPTDTRSTLATGLSVGLSGMASATNQGVF